MKKFFAVATLVLTCSCGDPNVRDVNEQIVVKAGEEKKVYEWVYKKHLYLVITGSDNNFSVVHAGHCICGGRKCNTD